MAMRFFMAPVGLFLLQAAPVDIGTDDGGRLRLSIGASAGSYRERLLSCSGEELDSYPVQTTEVTAEAEYWISPAVRVTGYAAHLQAATDRPVDDRINPLVEGWHGGGLISWEGRKIGLGAGLASVPDMAEDGSDAIWPALHFRAGRRERAHFLLVTGGTNLAANPGKAVRIGVGFGDGPGRRVSGQAGLAMTPYPSQDGAPWYYGSVLVPVSRLVEVGGAAAMSFVNSGWNLGLMTRVSLGGQRPAKVIGPG